MSKLTTLRRGKRVVLTATLLSAGTVLAGCSQGIENGALPSNPEITNQTGRIIDLWNGSWIAALVVGIITWGLILWTITVHRKRKNDNKLPVQTRAHLPLELMYTIVPLIMIAVLFKWTVQDVWALQDTSATPDVHVQAVGKQWSWDFNYTDENVYFAGVQANLTGEEGVRETLPTLYLPVDEVIEITVDSRDVIHSFWIPAFLYKIDAIPGKTNAFQVVPTKVGTYTGKCAELCGEYHASMLFTVKVVERAEYEEYIDWLHEIGNDGLLGLDYNRRSDVQDGE